jgi:hypothetical protein
VPDDIPARLFFSRKRAYGYARILLNALRAEELPPMVEAMDNRGRKMGFESDDWCAVVVITFENSRPVRFRYFPVEADDTQAAAE